MQPRDLDNITNGFHIAAQHSLIVVVHLLLVPAGNGIVYGERRSIE